MRKSILFLKGLLLVCMGCCVQSDDTQPFGFVSYNLLYPLESSAYLKHFKIKTYRKVWLDAKKQYQRVGGGHERFIVFNGVPAVILERKSFDRQGHLTEDYQYKSEGPFIDRYRYSYDLQGNIKTKSELSYIGTVYLHTYFDDAQSKQLDSVISTRLDFEEGGKDTTVSKYGKRYYEYRNKMLVAEKYFYEDILTASVQYLKVGLIDVIVEEDLVCHQKDTVFIWSKQHKVYQKIQYRHGYRFVYDARGLLVTERIYDRSFKNLEATSVYQYNALGLLQGETTQYAKGQVQRYVMDYTFYE